MTSARFVYGNVGEMAYVLLCLSNLVERQGFFIGESMKATFKNCQQYENGKIISADYSLELMNNGVDTVFNNCLILPAFCDVHVHLRAGFFL